MLLNLLKSKTSKRVATFKADQITAFINNVEKYQKSVLFLYYCTTVSLASVK